jgi:hypothetical protein
MRAGLNCPALIRGAAGSNESWGPPRRELWRCGLDSNRQIGRNLTQADSLPVQVSNHWSRMVTSSVCYWLVRSYIVHPHLTPHPTSSPGVSAVVIALGAIQTCAIVIWGDALCSGNEADGNPGIPDTDPRSGVPTLMCRSGVPHAGPHLRLYVHCITPRQAAHIPSSIRSVQVTRAGLPRSPPVPRTLPPPPPEGLFCTSACVCSRQRHQQVLIRLRSRDR